MNPLEQNFQNVPEIWSFFPKKRNKFEFFQRIATSRRHNSAMITERRMDRCTVGYRYVSNAAMTLATVSATIPVLFSDGTFRYGAHR